MNAHEAADILQNQELMSAFGDFFNGGGTLKMLKNLPPETMESTYEIAYNQYQNGQFKKAAKTFQMLCLLDHYQSKYYMGLGACRQMLKEYGQALNSYTHAALLDANSPYPPFHAAECHLALGNLTEAESGLFAATLWAADVPEHQLLKQRAEQMLDSVKKRIAEKMNNAHSNNYQ